jgi:mRNA interferase MazF
LVRLDPTLGSEIQKTRPCVIVSPVELNAHLREYVVLDQLRSVDRERLIKRLGTLPSQRLADMLSALREMFAE